MAPSIYFVPSCKMHKQRQKRLTKSTSVKLSSSSNSSSRSSAERDEQLVVRRSASVLSAPCDSSTSDDVAFPKGLSFQEKSCCCLSMDVLPGERSGQQMCGWGESRSVAKNSRNMHHNFALSWSLGEAYLSEVKTRNPNPVSKKNLNRSESGSKSSINYHGYISSASANRYPFQHHVDGDTALYIKEYRKFYTYRNLDERMRRMRVGAMSASSSQIKPKVIMLGYEGGQNRMTLASKSLRRIQVRYLMFNIEVARGQAAGTGYI